MKARPENQRNHEGGEKKDRHKTGEVPSTLVCCNKEKSLHREAKDEVSQAAGRSRPRQVMLRSRDFQKEV